MSKVRLQLTQPHHDADGNVLHQPGELFDEGDKLVKELPEGSFKAVIVDDKADDKAEKTDEKPAASRPAVSGKSA